MTTDLPQPSVVDEALYLQIAQEAKRFAGVQLPSDPSLRPGVESFLYLEADLLDRRRYEDWYELLAPDVVYWVPIGEPSEHPGRSVSVAFDDQRRMADRICWLRTGNVYSHQPPARTQRTIGNVQVWPIEDERLWVRSTFTMHARRRDATDSFVGHCEHVLSDDGPTFRIHRKRVSLISSDDYLHNLTLIL